MLRRITALVLSTLLVWLNTSATFAQTAAQPSLGDVVNRSYIQLLELSPSLHLSQSANHRRRPRPGAPLW
ncbi:MAG: hypothetical protein HY314_11335 [Acidobacteria bacterium]|nr:hypothetical protein [Acidobacteriota bacterium]